MKYQIVILMLQRCSRRKDDMRMPGSFVDVKIDRSHKLQTFERAIQPASIRRGEYRIACRSYDGFNLTGSFSQDLLSQSGNGKLACKFGQLSHTAVPSAKTASRRKRFRRCYR